MKTKDRILYNILHAMWWALSQLPMWWHYLWAEVLAFIAYHIVRYRRRLVRKNLTDSFPEKSLSEIKSIERTFYRHFCDIFLESLKYFGISRKEVMRRMQFKGLDLVEASIRNGRSCGVFLGHYANWEWISSLQLWIDPKEGCCVQLYHPLENVVTNRLVNYTRERMGSTNIPVSDSLRSILRLKAKGTPLVIGFIADQVPNWNNIHHWMPFLNHPETPVFTGAEQLMRRLDMDVYYLEAKQVSRGHYTAEFKLLSTTPNDCEEFALTEQYTHMLEETIREAPAYWLWSHNRWKRTREAWFERRSHQPSTKNNIKDLHT